MVVVVERVDFSRFRLCTSSAANSSPYMCCRVVVPLIGKSLMSACHYCCTGIHLGPSLACHWAEEVNGRHAHRLNGPWLIDQQTDDLNEWRERIKCLLSSPFIPCSCPALYLLLFLGGGASGLRGFVRRRRGLFTVETSGDIIIDMSTSSAPGWKAILTNST